MSPILKITAKYCLIQFTDDNVYYVCPSKYLKRTKQGTIIAPWIDHKFYPAKFLASSNNSKLLKGFLKNLETNYPLVHLNRLEDTSRLKNYENSSEGDYSDGNNNEYNGNNNLLDLCNKTSETLPGTYEVCKYSGTLYSVVDNHTCGQATCENGNSDMIVDQPLHEPLFHSGGDNGPNLETEEFNIDESLAVDKENNTADEIDTVSTSNFRQALFNKTNIETSINVVEDTEQTHLCMYCGTFVSNLNDHITRSHGQENAVIVDGESPKRNRISSHKRHCCIFCKKILFQIVRHWTSVHIQEEEVRIIKSLNVNNPLRKQKIDHLRKKGDYEFNRYHACDSKEHIVTRVSISREAAFVPCPSCFGYFSKKNLRHHKQRCCPNKGDRHLQGNSRKLTKHVHDKASETLKNIITPDMFHDEVANQIFFDEILVIYGNYLCIKYTEHHLKNHIRAQLRLLGRFMLKIKTHDESIKSCKDLIHSRNIDTIRRAIDDIAGLDALNNIYKHPTNARTLLTELRKVIQVVKSESDKTEDEILMKKVKGLSRRVKQELTPYINRVCKNSENKLRRLKQQKINELPENEEVGEYLKKLYKYISSARRELQNKFSISVWTKLIQCLMVYLAVFNRKRPGETQRIEIGDFENRESVTDKDLLDLDESEKIQAYKYERIGFRGKLGNSTALLIDKKKILPGLKLILKYREQAGVHTSNRFLFAKPSKIETNITFDAYRCHNHFCETMGINTENLTFTKLRKQFATDVAKKGTSQEEERRVSSYMSHDFNIHKKIYDHSASLIDITKVSKHLEVATEGKHKKEKNKAMATATANYRLSVLIGEEVASESSGENVSTKKKYLNSKSGVRNITQRKRNRSEIDYDLLVDRSSSSDDEPSLEEVEKCLGKIQKRRFWTSLEKHTTRTFFRKEIFGNDLVENEKVHRFKETYKEVMMHRPVTMIKQWIERQKFKIQQEKYGVKDKRPRYSTPEKELLETSTEHHSLEGSEPSLLEMEELISKHDILRHRTAESLVRKFRQMQHRKKPGLSDDSLFSSEEN